MTRLEYGMDDGMENGMEQWWYTTHVTGFAQSRLSYLM